VQCRHVDEQHGEREREGDAAEQEPVREQPGRAAHVPEELRERLQRIGDKVTFWSGTL
jgi:hypothetical protein